MNDPPATAPANAAERDYERHLRDMNEALLVSSVRQHELTEQAQEAEAALGKTQDLLRRNAELFARFVEHAPFGIYVVDSQFRITHVNDGAQPTFRNIKPLIGRDFAEAIRIIWPEPFASEVIGNFRRTLETGDPYLAPSLTERRQDVGVFESYEWQIHRVTLADGQYGVVCYFFDATRIRQAEQALRESEERFRNLADHAPVLIWVNSPAGCEFVNQTYLDFLGVAMEDVQWDGWAKYVHADDYEDYVGGYLAASQKQAPFEGEFRFRRADGEYRWMQTVGIPRRTPAGDFLGYVGSTLDITERRRGEDAQRESEERFRTLAENMAQFAWTADAKGWIYWYNQRWYDYTGTTLEEMQGWGWRKVHHPDHVDHVVERIQRSWDTGEIWEDTFPLRGKDGQYRWFLSRALPVRDEQGNVVRWFGTNTDVTERFEMEHQIKQQAESLADLHRRKDEFMAMLSHELRNPLAPIANAVQLLRLQKDPDAIQEQARTIIERQVGQLTRLIEDLMEVSRMSTGRIHLQEEQLDLRGVVERAVETVRPLIAQHRHALVVALSEAPVWIYGDAGRLEQVVVNLLTNAAKYTDNAGHIWLGAEQAGDEAVVRVRDTGVGIAPDLLPRIFDLFTQGERSLDRSQGGLGVGLALVRQIVQLHRGRVEASSVVGQGSEFIVRLPVVAPPTYSASPTAAGPADATTGRCRVLVVDDNVDCIYSMKTLLARVGHEVATALDGPTALDAVRAFAPQVVLLDIGIPKLDGYEVARRIRAESTLDGVLLVATTGYGQEVDRQRSREAGFDHHLVKPLDFKKVQELLGLAEQRPQAR